MSTSQKIRLDGCVLIHTHVSTYTGAKKLRPEDLGLSRDNTPPKTLASLGTFRACDPELLTPFSSARSAMARVCLESGTRCFGGFAVVNSAVVDVARQLDDIVANFYDYKSRFLRDFEIQRDIWVNRDEFAPWRDKLLSKVVEKSYLDHQLQCWWEAGELSASGSLPERFKSVTEGIGKSVLSEVATAARALLDQSLQKDGIERSEVTQKILSPIRKMRDKILAFTFTDNRFRDIVGYMNANLAALPQEGKMSGPDLVRIRSLVKLLADPDDLIATAAFARSELVVVADPVVQPSLPIDESPQINEAPAGSVRESTPAPVSSASESDGDGLAIVGDEPELVASDPSFDEAVATVDI